MFASKNYTLNFDGSHNNQANKAGAGCIIRDSNGNFIIAASYNLTKLNLPYYNVAIAEAIGLRNGLKLAQSKYLNLNYIKGDNKEIIDHVLGVASRKPEPALAGIIEEIKVLFGQGFADIELISRDANKVADRFASIGCLLDGASSKVFDTFNYFEIPPQVIDLIEQEKSTNIGNGEGSSLATNIGKAGAAVAGVAMLAWGVSKLFSDDTSSSSRPSQPPNSWKSLTDTLATFSQNPPNSPAFPTSNTPKPTPGFFTLQYFGSDRNQLQKARAGCIITNRGKFLVAGAYNLDDHYPDCNIAIAEAIALWKGLELAKGNNVKLNVIQGRNVEVRDRVLGVEKRRARTVDLQNFTRQIRFALSDQGVDVDKCLELVDEESIKVARALSTEGGRLDKEEMVYRGVYELPTMVADLVNN